MRAKGFFGPVTQPYVAGGEGVGQLADGTRVYFGHSLPPYGAWAERTIVSNEEIWTIPDEIDDAQAISLGISGTGDRKSVVEGKSGSVSVDLGGRRNHKK